MVHQWGFFGSISAIRKIWSLTANSRSLQAAALKNKGKDQMVIPKSGRGRLPERSLTRAFDYRVSLYIH